MLQLMTFVVFPFFLYFPFQIALPEMSDLPSGKHMGREIILSAVQTLEG